MKKLIILFSAIAVVYGCSGNKTSQESSTTNEVVKEVKEENLQKTDDTRGIGKFTHVDVSVNLNVEMANEGQKISDVKCISCHRLTDEKLVGPGWKDVTRRRTPEWIMNFSTNTDEMIDKDPAAQAMLELCLVRMPNQNLSEEEARKIYEFMRKNDGVK